MPEDFKRWQSDRETQNFKSMYIAKPSASSCGRGIRIIGKRQTVNKMRNGYIVSKYLAKPHLVRGYKYDLRVYVLVTSFEPLKIYLFSEGLVRLATVPYTTSKSSLKQRFVHLTNYSVNKKADSYQKNNQTTTNEEQEPDAPESKLSFAQLRKEFEGEGADFDATWERIKDVIIKTVLSVENPIVTSMASGSKHKTSCFEVFGFDILID
jgi:tubulin polyglutamylase TTLL4